MLTILLTAACTYALFLLVHWIPFRLSIVENRTQTMTRTFLLCLPSAFLWFKLLDGKISAEIDGSPIAGAFFSTVFFTLLWCGYVQFVFAFDTSPSLRVLVEFFDREGEMSRTEITNLMAFPLTFRRRFLRALNNGAIQDHGNDTSEKTFSNKRTGERLATVGRWAKGFFRLGPGG